MEEEHEMCQNCKRDISVANYRTHTLHCRRNVVLCKDCNEKVPKGDLERHMSQAHSLRVCDQCNISVEARKLNDHRTALCPKLLLVCKFCEEEHPAASMSAHEMSCAEGSDQCAQCMQWVRRKVWDAHQGQLHGLLVQRSPHRQRKVTEKDIEAAPSVAADTTSMLPCEFCEGLVPINKLLEHQAECVNPTNVRGSSVLRNSASVTSFHAGGGSSLARSQSLHASYAYKRQFSVDANNDDGTREAEENTSARGTAERYLHPGYQHQSSVYNPSLSRASSLREAREAREAMEARQSRATTEERTLIRSGLYRQSSFTERSIRRRSESLSRQSSVSRSSRYVAGLYYNSDYLSAARRTSLFDGYSGYAVYSSINQGLDDISSCGRQLSRRNSVTELSRRGSLSNLSQAEFSYPTLLATYEATKVPNNKDKTVVEMKAIPKQESVKAVATSEVKKAFAKEVKCPTKEVAPSVVPKTKPESESKIAAAAAPKATDAVSKEPAHHVVKIKIRRSVSFTEKEPVVIESREIFGGEEVADGVEPDRRPPQQVTMRRTRRDKDGNKVVLRRSSKKDFQQMQTTLSEERRKSQPIGDDLFEQVSSKLKALEQSQQMDELEQQYVPTVHVVEKQHKLVEYRQHQPEEVDMSSAFGDCSSSSSKGATSTEASPKQKQRNRNSFGMFGSSSVNSPLEQSLLRNGPDKEQQPECCPPAPLRLRANLAGLDSKSGSKRNSLDAKTVQGLAQDLAAECARAYALMESSLSKLASGATSSGGPFGMRNKKPRKPSKTSSESQ